MKISILCFDLSDNAAGRAHLLAQLLAPIAGGRGRRPAPWPGRVAAGGRRTACATSGVLVVAGSALCGSRARLASRRRRGSPVRLQAEAGFGGHRPSQAPHRETPAAARHRRLGSRLLPPGGAWGTLGRGAEPRAIQRTALDLAHGAPRCVPDGVTVASRFLQRASGASSSRTCGDTDAWRPGDDRPRRGPEQLGLSDERIVMFLGTAREHTRGWMTWSRRSRAAATATSPWRWSGPIPSATGRRLRACLPGLRSGAGPSPSRRCRASSRRPTSWPSRSATAPIRVGTRQAIRRHGAGPTHRGHARVHDPGNPRRLWAGGSGPAIRHAPGRHRTAPRRSPGGPGLRLPRADLLCRAVRASPPPDATSSRW